MLPRDASLCTFYPVRAAVRWPPLEASIFVQMMHPLKIPSQGLLIDFPSIHTLCSKVLVFVCSIHTLCSIVLVYICSIHVLRVVKCSWMYICIDNIYSYNKYSTLDYKSSTKNEWAFYSLHFTHLYHVPYRHSFFLQKLGKTEIFTYTHSYMYENIYWRYK